MNRFIFKISILITCVCFSACATHPPSPIHDIRVSRPGTAKVVVVCPSRGIGARIVIDSEQQAEVRNGGHVSFDLAPGRHVLSLEIPYALSSPGMHAHSFSIAENEVLFFSVNPSGPLETPRMNSPAGYSSHAIPWSAPGPIGVSLVPVSREKGARIALF